MKIYCSVTNEWYYHDGITAKSFVVEDLEEGMKTFYIRSHCDTLIGAWTSKSSFFFYPNARCINYLGLSNKNCFFGTFDNPIASSGAVDNGYQSKFSRHTLHYDPNEYDPITGGALKTVPAGELASVRLGNWNTGREAESVSYDYVVDTVDGALLMLNYAIVMEDPQHEVNAQPKFTLDITEQGMPLPYGCGSAFFAAGHGMDPSDKTWHSFSSTGQSTGGYWKDWTTVGINLAQYHGKSLKIKLTTYDCDASGHFGYAYFTLGCSSGKIEGLSCGDAPENGFKGPDGFPLTFQSSSFKVSIKGSTAGSPIRLKAVEASLLTNLLLSLNVSINAGIAFGSPIAPNKVAAFNLICFFLLDNASIKGSNASSALN